MGFFYGAFEVPRRKWTFLIFFSYFATYGFALLEGETIMIISITKPCSFSQLGNRESQEDCLCPVDANKQTSYFVVCDGVGGRDHGEVASKLVCQSIEGYLANESCSELKAEDILQLVEHAYYTLYNNRAICPTMATTLAFMAKTSEGMLLAHLGDSRIYQIRKEEGIIFQTKDHSLVNDLIEEGVITPAEAIDHPKRNVITKCLFVTNNPADYQTPSITLICNIQPHDVFMLCTDGVYTKVKDKDIAEILTSDAPLDEKAKELAMICRDSDDNNTAYLIEIDKVEGRDEQLENISYIVPKSNRKTKLSRIWDFVRETLGFVKEP